jgi:hypothetical protein
VSVVIAGDAGVSDFTDQIMAQMIAQKPHLAVIGGDVAYDNGFMSCACTWDAFISMWESKRVDGRFLVPLSFAAGNHDLAVNDKNMGAFDPQEITCNPETITRAKPLFFGWFPLDTLTGDSVVEPAPVCLRKTLHLHTIPGLLNAWILDSAYAVSPEANVAFVDAKMDALGARNIAIYHVPLYSSNPQDYHKGAYLRDAWISPMFDKHAFGACFENHAHTYKRTQRMYGNAVSDGTKGTVYLGDGKMGISGMAVPGADSITSPSENPVFAKTGDNYHFFLVQTSTSDQRLSISVIDNNGIVFDSYITNV